MLFILITFRKRISQNYYTIFYYSFLKYIRIVYESDVDLQESTWPITPLENYYIIIIIIDYY